MPKIPLGNIKGPAGTSDTDGFVKTAFIDIHNHLILTLGDDSTVDVGSFTSAFVSHGEIDDTDHLILTLGDTSTVDLGSVNPTPDLINPSLTPAAGTDWTVSSFTARIVMGRIASIHLDATYSGTTLTSSSSGNITDTIVASLPTGLKPAFEEIHAFDKGGVAAGGAFIGTNGDITLKTLAPTATIASGDPVHIGCTYLLA